MNHPAPLSHRCLDCFSPLGEHTVCPYCHVSQAEERASFALPREFYLNDQFILGRVEFHDDMDIVYLAWDCQLEMRVLVREFYPFSLAMRNKNRLLPLEKENKVLLAKAVRAYHDQYRRLAQIDSPGLLRTRHLFMANNTAYVVQDYHVFRALGDVLVDEAVCLPGITGIKLILAVMEGLGEAHSMGCPHLALDPGSVWVTPEGKVLLTGFAKYRYRLGLESAAIPSMKPSPFMAPELRNGARTVGVPSDIYSLCALLLRILTGSAPPEHPTRQSLESALADYRGPDVLDILDAGLRSHVPDRIGSVPQLEGLLRQLLEPHVIHEPAGDQQDDDGMPEDIVVSPLEDAWQEPPLSDEKPPQQALNVEGVWERVKVVVGVAVAVALLSFGVKPVWPFLLFGFGLALSAVLWAALRPKPVPTKSVDLDRDTDDLWPLEKSVPKPAPILDYTQILKGQMQTQLQPNQDLERPATEPTKDADQIQEHQDLVEDQDLAQTQPQPSDEQVLPEPEPLSAKEMQALERMQRQAAEEKLRKAFKKAIKKEKYLKAGQIVMQMAHLGLPTDDMKRRLKNKIYSEID